VAKLPRLASRLKNRDFTSSAMLIAGMAAERSFQAHHVRLDWAIRMLAVCAGGDRTLDRVGLNRLLNEDFPKLRIDAQEDPLEQPFIGRVVTPHGEFRFVTGIYDQSIAFTDLVVSAFQALDSPDAVKAFRNILALLTLSDALVERGGEETWIVGPDTPVARIDVPSDVVLAQLGARSRFTADDLRQLDIDPAALDAFRLTQADLELLAAAPIGSSPLERRPLWRSGTDWIVLSPGAISVAVRTCLIDAVVERGLQRPMALRMLSFQHDRLTEAGFLKDVSKAVVEHAGQPALDYTVEISAGRFCHVLETMDDFGDWPDRTFCSGRRCSPQAEMALAQSIANARTAARNAPDFREGFSLWLAGGWGSGRSIAAHILDRFSDWPVIIIEPGEACVLALGEAGRPRDLLRLETLRRRLVADGFELHHPGTLLNLHAFWRENDHGLLPAEEDFRPPMNIQFGLMRLGEISAEAYRSWDRRALPHPRFGWGPVSRMERRPWSGSLEPVYASVEAMQDQRLIGAAVDPTGLAWVEAVGSADRETLFQSWHAALLWWRRVSSVWAQWSGLAFSVVDLVLSIDPPPVNDWVEASDDQINAAVKVWRAENGVIRIHLGRDWHQGALRVDNRSEMALAASLVQAAAITEGRDLGWAAALALVQTVAAPDIRHRHASEVVRVIEALGAADLIQPMPRMSQTAMSAEKYGSVWRVRSPDAPREIRGPECATLVRACLAAEIADLRAMVGRFDRASLVVAALQAQQAAVMEARSWETTARAMRAINGVEQDLRYSLDQRNQINSVLRLSAVIAEFAQTDGASSGGLSVGRMDMEELQAKTMALIHVADMLPALISGQQNRLLKISPSGDLLSDRRFSDTTLKATATQVHAMDRLQADTDYDLRRTGQIAPAPAEADLAAALQAEYGVPHAVLREFAMGVAQLALAEGADVIVKRRGALIAALAEDELLAGSALEPLVDRLTLPCRGDWLEIPPDAVAGDFDISKFDRPRSLIGRPIPALTKDNDPLLVLAPAVIERALVHNLSGALGGDLQNRFWSSRLMQQFASRQGARTGLEFNEAVADAVARQGPRTWVGRSLSWCLHRKQSDELDRLGDIDVLAFSERDNVVWVIEAKDLKLCRTLGEVARRLANYQGRTDKKGRPDALLRHLRRVAFLRDNAADLRKRLGLKDTPRICGLVIVKSPQPMAQLTGTFYDDARVAQLDRLEDIPWRTGWGAGERQSAPDRQA
jgi:hypothetical protein